MADACDRNDLAVRRLRVGFRKARHRTYDAHRGDRRRRAGAGTSTQPDRDHHLRADARRLFRLGIPLIYRHWSLRQALRPRRGALSRGHAEPRLRDRHQFQSLHRLSMEENTMTMQALVIAHAAFGHNHFFRNNHLFRQWTDAAAILDYLAFARISSPNARSGMALRPSSGSSTPPMPCRARACTAICGANGGSPTRSERARERQKYQEETYNPLWSTVPGSDRAARCTAHGERSQGGAQPARRKTFSICVRSTPRGCAAGNANWCASCAWWRSISTLRCKPSWPTRAAPGGALRHHDPPA